MFLATSTVVGAIATSAGHPQLPNPSLTPGAVVTTDWHVACRTHTGSESDSVRNVSTKVAKSVYLSYGLGGNHTNYCAEVAAGCEVDHLVPLKLGGSNDATNLWPQSYGHPMGAIEKYNLEKRLIARVCRVSAKHPVRLPLVVAQRAISTNWIAAYTKYVTNNE
jgi:hypothetical protein